MLNCFCCTRIRQVDSCLVLTGDFMGVFDIIMIGIGLSMDAFAVATTNGITMKPNFKQALAIAFAFGLFQAVMPLIGFFAGSLFGDIVEKYDHWIALVLLAIIGGKMIADFFEKDEGDDSMSTSKAHSDEYNALYTGIAESWISKGYIPVIKRS